MDKKMMAVAVVAIVVIAGVAAFLVLNNGGEKKSFGTSTNTESRLTIFGNANGDDYIDQRDVDTVKAIIAGEQEATYFDCYLSYGGKVVQRSFADANADGKIDQADVDIIQNMVDRKQNMQVKFSANEPQDKGVKVPVEHHEVKEEPYGGAYSKYLKK